jgi:hypothetical protein
MFLPSSSDNRLKPFLMEYFFLLTIHYLWLRLTHSLWKIKVVTGAWRKNVPFKNILTHCRFNFSSDFVDTRKQVALERRLAWSRQQLQTTSPKIFSLNDGLRGIIWSWGQNKRSSCWYWDWRKTFGISYRARTAKSCHRSI